jgi:kynureninase
MTDRAACEALDRADPLRSTRELFSLPDGLIYLDGNSLGAMPAHVPDRLATVAAEEWGRDLITSWNRHGWAELPYRVGDRIARIIGTAPGTVVAADSTSVNLFKVVSAALNLTDRKVVLSDSGNFPTDLYVMSSISDLRIVEPDEIIEAVDEDVGVVAITHVGYDTGRMHDMSAITAAAHAAGALMVWDLAHSAGAMALDLGDTDFAVGCGYKYLNGGPGAPAFVYIHPDRMEAFRNPITGWFAHAAPFDFTRQFVPADGISRARVGTPHVLSLAALDSALDVFEGIDMQAVRTKSLALTDLFMDLVDASDVPVKVVTPRERERRGSQVCLSHPDGYAIVQALIERRVIGDFRAPDVLRFGFAPLYVSYTDVYDAVSLLVDVIETGAYKDPHFSTRNPVT